MRLRLLFFVTIALGLLTNLVATWADKVFGLTDAARFTVIIGVYVGVIGFGFLLDAGVGLPGTFLFHRYLYLLGLGNPRRLSRGAREFAPLHLGRGPRYVSSEIWADGERRDLVDFLSKALTSTPHQQRSILILGEPGCGKTTALERLTVQLAKYSVRRFGLSGPVPVLIQAGDCRSGDDLETIVANALRSATHGNTRQILASVSGTRRLLDTPRLVILFDALDELNGERLTSVLRALAGTTHGPLAAGASVLVSCRTRQDPGAALDGFDTYSILDLSDDSVAAFIRTYWQGDAPADQRLYDDLRDGTFLEPGGLGRNSFWLKQLVAVGTEKRNKSAILASASRLALAAELAKPMQAQRRWARPPDLSPDQCIDECMAALAHLALSNREEPVLTRDAARRQLVEWFKTRHEQLGVAVLSPDQALELARDAGLVSRVDDPVRFAHRIVEEFFEALVLTTSNGPLPTETLRAYMADPRSWHTLSLYGGLLPRAQRETLTGAIYAADSSAAGLACALAVYFGDNNPTVGPMASELYGALRSTVADHEDLNPQLRESLRQFLVVGHNLGAQSLGILLADIEPEVRVRACALLGLLPIPECVRLLAYVALDDIEDSVGDAAIGALAELGQVAIWPLIRQLYTERYHVRERAARALARIEAVDATEHLLKCPLTNLHAGYALARCAARRVGRLLVGLASDDARIQLRCIAALGTIGDARAVEPVTFAVQDKVREVREAALQFLDVLDAKAMAAGAPTTLALNALTNALDQAEVETKLWVIQTLQYRREPAVTALLRRALGSYEPTVRGAGANALRARAALQSPAEQIRTENERSLVSEATDSAFDNGRERDSRSAAGQEMHQNQAVIDDWISGGSNRTSLRLAPWTGFNSGFRLPRFGYGVDSAFWQGLVDADPAVRRATTARIDNFGIQEAERELLTLLSGTLDVPAIKNGAPNATAPSDPHRQAWIQQLHRADAIAWMLLHTASNPREAAYEFACSLVEQLPCAWLARMLPVFCATTHVRPTPDMVGLIGRIGDVTISPLLLVRLAESTASDELSIAIAKTLGQLGDDNSVQPLLELVNKGTSPAVRNSAALALQLCGPPSVSALRRVIDQPKARPRVIAAAIDALACAGDVTPKTIQKYAALVDYRDVEVSAAASAALAAAADRAPLAALGPGIARSTATRMYIQLLLLLIRGEPRQVAVQSAVRWSTASPSSAEAIPRSAPSHAALASATPAAPDPEENLDDEPAAEIWSVLDHLSELCGRFGACSLAFLCLGLAGAILFQPMVGVLAAVVYHMPATALRAYLPAGGLAVEIMALTFAAWLGVPFLIYETTAFLYPALYLDEQRVLGALAVRCAGAIIGIPFLVSVVAFIVRPLADFAHVPISESDLIWITNRLSICTMLLILAWSGGRPLWKFLTAQMNALFISGLGGAQRTLLAAALRAASRAAQFLLIVGVVAAAITPSYIVASVLLAAFAATCSGALLVALRVATVPISNRIGRWSMSRIARVMFAGALTGFISLPVILITHGYAATTVCAWIADAPHLALCSTGDPRLEAWYGTTQIAWLTWVAIGVTASLLVLVPATPRTRLLLGLAAAAWLLFAALPLLLAMVGRAFTPGVERFVSLDEFTYEPLGVRMLLLFAGVSLYATLQRTWSARSRKILQTERLAALTPIAVAVLGPDALVSAFTLLPSLLNVCLAAAVAALFVRLGGKATIQIARDFLQSADKLQSDLEQMIAGEAAEGS